jgi:hypothetical protein
MEQLIAVMNESITQVADLAKKLLAETTRTMYTRESSIRHTVRSSCNQALRDCRSALQAERDHTVEALTSQYQNMELEKRRDYEAEIDNTKQLLDQMMEQKAVQDKKILDLCAHNFLSEQHLGIKLVELDQERESHTKNKQLFNQELARLRRKEVEDVFKIISLKKSLKNVQDLLMKKSDQCDHIQKQSMELERKLHVSKNLRNLLEKKYHGNKLKLKLYEEGKLSSITRGRLCPSRIIQTTKPEKRTQCNGAIVPWVMSAQFTHDSVDIHDDAV